MSLVRWLRENKTAYYGNYFQAKSYYAVGKYLAFARCSTNIAAEMDKQWKTPAAKRLAIAAIDPQTRKNAFHEVFLENLFSTTMALNPQDYFMSYVDANAKKRAAEGSLWIAADLDANVAEHTNLLQQGKLTQNQPGQTFLKNNLTATVSLLLAPFANTATENHDEAFMSAFLQPDSSGNTPFFYACQKLSTEMDFTALLTRINQLSPDNKKKLYFASNQDGKTIMHLVLKNWGIPGGLTEEITILGPDLAKEAICQKDKVGNTPLHELFQHREQPSVDFVHIICELIKPSQSVNAPEQKQDKLQSSFLSAQRPRAFSEEKQIHNPFLDNLLCKNLAGLNPLHLLCQRKLSEDNITMFNDLAKVLPGNLLADKIMEQDKDKMTPLHYAIRSGNISLAKRMLDRLRPAQQKEIMGVMLQDVCRYGNPDLLEKAIEIIGPLKLYRIRSASPLKACGSNLHLSQNSIDVIIKKHNKLFDLFDYFVKTYDSTSADFSSRFKDFCNCFAAIQAGLKMPAENADFYAKKRGFGIFAWNSSETYHQLRFSLSDNVTMEERADFIAFLSVITAAESEQSKQVLVAREILEAFVIEYKEEKPPVASKAVTATSSIKPPAYTPPLIRHASSSLTNFPIAEVVKEERSRSRSRSG